MRLKLLIPIFSLTIFWQSLALNLVLAQTANQLEQPLTKNELQLTELILDPSPPVLGELNVTLKVQRGSGEAANDLELEGELFMPGMGAMPPMSNKAKAKALGKGRYQLPLTILMDGSWEFSLRIKQKDSEEITEFPFGLTSGIEKLNYKGQIDSKKSNKGGSNTVYLSEPRRQLIGVEIGKVQRMLIQREIHTVARLEVAEPWVYDVVLRYNGYVQELFANKTGDYVEKGQSLMTVYSPELYAAQTEYLHLFKDSGNPYTMAALTKAMRDKLKFWNMAEEQIDSLEKEKRASAKQNIVSPVAGFVLKKNVNTGSAVNAGTQLFQIADLNQLWAIAEVFEYEADLVKLGDEVSLTLPYLSNVQMVGKISKIYPTINMETRTLQVRVEIPNLDNKLRPGMYANALIKSLSAERLVLPRRAVLFSGNHKYVFVSLGEGYFEPREIQTGLQTGEWFEVTQGLQEGTEVSFSANFLISSEAQLRNVLPLWGKPTQNHGGKHD